MLTCLIIVTGISLSILGQSSSELIESAWSQTTMGNETDGTAQGNMTAGDGNMTAGDGNMTGNISTTGNEGF